MYSKAEASQIRQSFWTTFGRYIAPHPSAEGMKVNWLNYKTGVKHVYFRMHADHRQASIGIEITHPDPGLQELFFLQFTELKTMLESLMEENWEWKLHTTDPHGQIISRIYKEITPVNVFNQEEWPALISFLKPRLITLDEFWTDAKYSFDSLK